MEWEFSQHIFPSNPVLVLSWAKIPKKKGNLVGKRAQIGAGAATSRESTAKEKLFPGHLFPMDLPGILALGMP